MLGSLCMRQNLVQKLATKSIIYFCADRSRINSSMGCENSSVIKLFTKKLLLPEAISQFYPSDKNLKLSGTQTNLEFYSNAIKNSGLSCLPCQFSLSF